MPKIEDLDRFAGASHSGSVREYLPFDRDEIPTDDIIKILTHLHNDIVSDPTDRDRLTKEISDNSYLSLDAYRSRTPTSIFKRLKKIHADAMLQKGEIGLGSLRYFNVVDSKDIKDINEGVFVAHAVGKGINVFTQFDVGCHVLLYCTTMNADANFTDYDACVEITDINAFSNIVAQAIRKHFEGQNRLNHVEHGSCVYQYSRIVHGEMSKRGEAVAKSGKISVASIDTLAHRQYLIKENQFKDDKEYRMAFVMNNDVDSYAVIQCPEIIPLCRRIK